MPQTKKIVPSSRVMSDHDAPRPVSGFSLSDRMPPWHLWSQGETLAALANIEPLLASWNSNADPAQIRVQRYLDDLQTAVGPLPAGVAPLALHMRIDVARPEHLLRHHDLENYLFPVVYRFGATRFAFVSATKHVGGGSRLLIGRAKPGIPATALDGWGHCSCHAGSGATKKEWKIGIRDALLATRPTILPPGPVAVHLAWRCSRQRNWSMLWKPSGDAMGPVLGEPLPTTPFNPRDDRIVSLALHLNMDDAMGHDVDVGMWWRSAALDADASCRDRTDIG